MIAQELSNGKKRIGGDQTIVLFALNNIDKCWSFPSLVKSIGRHSQPPSPTQYMFGKRFKFRISEKQKKFHQFKPIFF